MTRTTYTVIARYDDGEEQRYATTVEARDPGEAEELAQEAARQDNPGEYLDEEGPLLIAGVVKGEVEVVA